MAAQDKNRRLLEAMLDPANRSLAAVATAAGLSEKQARRVRQSPEFVEMLDRAQGEAIDDITARLVATLPLAERTMVVVMLDVTNPPGVRIRAATALSELAMRLYDNRLLERRVAALEEAIGGPQ